MKLIRTLGLAAFTALATVGSGITHAQQQFVTVLTGGTSGVYYPLGVALSKV